MRKLLGAGKPRAIADLLGQLAATLDLINGRKSTTARVPAPGFQSSLAGEHNHVSPAFGVEVKSDGTRAFFSSTDFDALDVHSHLIDPSFDVTVTYDFEPIPEPLSSLLAVTGTVM